jgi:uncharacterized membrane protein
MGANASKLLYWGLDDDLALAIIFLSVLSIYYALAITRTTKGAPRGWYIITIGFVTLFIFRVVQLYYDAQSPSDIIDDTEATISLLVGVFFVIGLLMLNRSFRRRLERVKAS